MVSLARSSGNARACARQPMSLRQRHDEGFSPDRFEVARPVSSAGRRMNPTSRRPAAALHTCARREQRVPLHRRRECACATRGARAGARRGRRRTRSRSRGDRSRRGRRRTTRASPARSPRGSAGRGPKRPPRGRELGATLRAVEEGGPELPLELADLLAQRRLRSRRDRGSAKWSSSAPRDEVAHDGGLHPSTHIRDVSVARHKYI